MLSRSSRRREQSLEMAARVEVSFGDWLLLQSSIEDSVCCTMPLADSITLQTPNTYAEKAVAPTGAQVPFRISRRPLLLEPRSSSIRKRARVYIGRESY